MKQKGFTLIELLVVIAIIAILTTVVIGSLNKSKIKSRDAKRVSDIAQIQLALELYYDRCKQYPQTVTTSGANPLSVAANNGCPSGINLGTFINPIPRPPSGSTVTTEEYYRYVGLNTGCTAYHLGATLEGYSANQGPLRDDLDASASGTAGQCRSGSTDFSGADPIYDVKQ